MSVSTTRTRRKREPKPVYSNNEIRQLTLWYLYDRNQCARSERGDKTGAAVKISVMRRELKASHDLAQSEIRSNLTYLISQGWVEKEPFVRSVPLPRGTILPASTLYYRITAAGIDKIEGPGEFTMDKFHGIKIEATGQNIITVNDGNQVNAKFADAAQELAELKEEVRESSGLTEEDKISLIGDIDSIQSQLGKTKPNTSVITTLWDGVEKAGKLAGLVEKVIKVGGYLAAVLNG